jgi:DNA repair protein RadD
VYDAYKYEISILRKLDATELRAFVGNSIVTAVETSFNTNVESILAELLIHKYGETLLDKKVLRMSLIDVTEEQKVLKLASDLGCKEKTPLIASDWLRKYFAKGYSPEKSRIFVDWLGFSERFCKVNITDSREEVELVSVNHGEKISLRGYLHPYQKGVKDQILSSLNSPGVRLMVQMPTGAGKTFTALETVVDILRLPFQKKFSVWLVNSNELSEQALQSFKSLWKVKGDRPLETFRLFKKFSPAFSSHQNGGVVFASYDLFYSILSNIEDFRREELLYLIENTEYLIVDEAHAAVAETYQACVLAFISNDFTKVVGLSATPLREEPEEALELRRLFSNNLISVRDDSNNVVNDPIRYLQSGLYLSKLKVETLDTGFAFSGNSENTVLKALSEDSPRNKLILKQIEYANSIQDKTLVFACTKDHVLALYIMCISVGLKVKYIIGETPQSERPKILSEFNDGDTNVLINLDILSTGIDLPNVNRLIITRPVRSSIQYSQIVGRALRGPKNGGNQYNTIINILDNIEYFSGMSLLYDKFRNDWE